MTESIIRVRKYEEHAKEHSDGNIDYEWLTDECKGDASQLDLGKLSAAKNKKFVLRNW